MTRVRARAGLASAVICGLALLGCGDGGSHSVSSLIADEDRLNGHAVTVTGVVQHLGATDGAMRPHYVLQDADANRVRLLPDDAVEQYVSRVVQIEGTFEFSETTGRVLQVRRVEPLASG